jgi:hypothetical protein
MSTSNTWTEGDWDTGEPVATWEQRGQVWFCQSDSRTMRLVNQRWQVGFVTEEGSVSHMWTDATDQGLAAYCASDVVHYHGHPDVPQLTMAMADWR